MESDNQRKNELRIPPPPYPAKRPATHPTPPTPVAPEALASEKVATLPAAANLSTIELFKEISAEITHLVGKQIELAKIELKADLKTQAMAAIGLSLAAVGAICTVNLLLMSAVFALATTMPGWSAGLFMGSITLTASVFVAWLAWNRRVRKPLERTQRTLKDDLQWTKERLV